MFCFIAVLLGKQQTLALSQLSRVIISFLKNKVVRSRRKDTSFFLVFLQGEYGAQEILFFFFFFALLHYLHNTGLRIV